MTASGTVGIAGPIQFSIKHLVDEPGPPQTVTLEGFGSVRIALVDNVLSVRTEQDMELRFNLFDAARELTNPISNEPQPVELHAANGSLSGTLLIDNFSGTFQEPRLGIVLLRCWLILSKT